MKQRNYKVKGAKVNFMVYWLEEESQKEVKIILPEIQFQKVENE